MELHAGDFINARTPQGVGMGFKPEKYLMDCKVVKTGIDGIGSITNHLKNYKA
jgi:2-keto-4-pentenoate hydratase/2-oxohepta-3-ene-1,7-dioic acid hydratase in catechol pathway